MPAVNRGAKRKYTSASTTRRYKKAKIRGPWYVRWQTYAFLVLFGVIGTVALLISNAATQGNCVTVTSDTGSTMQICVAQPASSSVDGTASYLGKTGSSRLNTATLTLYSCTRDTVQCTQVTSTSKIVRPNLFKPNKALVTTPTVPYQSTNVYKACIGFSDSTGWQAQDVCSKIADFSPVTTSQTTTTPTTTPTPTSSTACGGTTLTKSDGSTWQCTFSDDFSGSMYDQAKWIPQLTATSGFTTGVPPGRVCYVNNSKTISVSGGYLQLSVVKEPQLFTCAPGSKGAFSTQYAGGELTTYKLFSQQYGKFEIRAKLPSERQKGLQETLWLWPNDSLKYGAWPASGEIDLAEFYSLYADYNVPYIHYNYSSYDSNTNTNIVTLLSKTYNHNYDNCKINFGEFNTYAAIWRSGYIELDVNGKPCVVDNYASTVGAQPAPFDQPFFIALTQALGVSPNQFDEANPPQLPATTQVDYVYAWK